jgi:hypothetical protein
VRRRAQRLTTPQEQASALGDKGLFSLLPFDVDGRRRPSG